MALERLSRRALLGRLRGGPPQLRPPWAVEEELFTDRCTQCEACVEACPEHIIERGHAGYPIVLFERAGCTFCGACRDACPEACFEQGETERAWSQLATVKPICLETKGIACRTCEAACEHSALKFKPKVGGGSDVTVDRRSCTGCGSCVAACPLAAIVVLPGSSVENRP